MSEAHSRVESLYTRSTSQRGWGYHRQRKTPILPIGSLVGLVGCGCSDLAAQQASDASIFAARNVFPREGGLCRMRSLETESDTSLLHIKRRCVLSNGSQRPLTLCFLMRFCRVIFFIRTARLAGRPSTTRYTFNLIALPSVIF